MEDYSPIEDYGVIGNMYTAALIDKEDASIDYLCYPDFDSPSVFARLLDAEHGGHFSVGPSHSPDLLTKQVYLVETNILRTRFSCHQGIGQVTDLMPVQKGTEPAKPHCLPWIIRRLDTVRGAFEFNLECFPAFNYGRDPHTVVLEGNSAIFSSKALSLCLTVIGDSTLAWSSDVGDIKANVILNEGQSLFLILAGDKLCVNRDNVEDLMKATENYWRDWASQCTYTGRWREMVLRSALILKLHTYAPTGAIVASPTTSLPEDSWMAPTERSSSAARNWDYRYTWIRDAAFTVYAFLRIGFKTEAEAFMQWIEARCHQLKEMGSEEGLRVLYDIRGHFPNSNLKDYAEEEPEHWEGYRGQRPVRIGNSAAGQVQLDIYGELMDAVYLCDKHVKPIGWDFWLAVKETIVAPVIQGWRQADHGIWEMRGERREYVHSKVMAWVAVDRAVRLAMKRSLPADLSLWMATRDAIKEDVMEKGWNAEMGAFTQSYGSTELDASVLMMPLVFFISPSDPRMLSTINRMKDAPAHGGLTINHLVFRFAACSKLVCRVPAEGTFTMCSFWLAEAMARAGEHEEGMLEAAREMFEDLLGYANHLGLYSEEIDLSGRALGNFPQALTHMSLISAAFNIDRRL